MNYLANFQMEPLTTNKMNRQNIIVVTKWNQIQCWGNFKKACEGNNLPYHSLKMLKFPINYKGLKIEKVRFNEA